MKSSGCGVGNWCFERFAVEDSCIVEYSSRVRVTERCAVEDVYGVCCSVL